MNDRAGDGLVAAVAEGVEEIEYEDVGIRDDGWVGVRLSDPEFVVERF